ncbi:MAG: 1-deoxy-D-xylulose-5-phosphate synthase [Bacteroides sp.]|nr:1-deoxy-D-xylulose-5-phosphate synthase [Bacteroides sp.]
MKATDIKSPADIRSLSIAELRPLCAELRDILLAKLAARGGHAGPNLGFLEPTVALHYVFDTPHDKIVFDVSHQTYVHKMLTGRIAAFADPARYAEVTGYTNPAESPYDLFSIGHTSTSVSLASGLALARDLRGGHERVVAVIGDGSLSGGQAFEALDYAAELHSNFIVVVNDNQMSIAPNHGGLYDDLRALRESNGTAPRNIFRSLGYDYVYVPYGNDLASLIEAFEYVKDAERPVVVHLNTMKGEGYAPAERNKERFHYSGPFDRATGDAPAAPEGYTDIFAEHMIERMAADPAMVTITAGTPGAIGFTPARRERAGRQFVDVGIAEEQAVSMSSGLAKGGARPVFGVCATFLQRAYDQLSQDCCINGQPAVFNIFYGGVWGMTDATHLGFFDVPMVANIPGMCFLEPTCREEYLAMLDWAIDHATGPTAVRVPGGAIVSRPGDYARDYSRPGWETVRPGAGDVAIVGAGSFLPLALDAAMMASQHGIDAAVYNPRRVDTLDPAAIESLRRCRLVITLEDNSVEGGFGQKVATALAAGKDAPEVRVLGLPAAFADRYLPADLLASRGLTPEAIAALAKP